MPPYIKGLRDDEASSVVTEGAVGDESFDCTTSFQKSVGYGILSGSKQIKVPFGTGAKYKVTGTVKIESSGFSISGDAPGNYNPSSYIFSNVVGLPAIFDYGNSKKILPVGQFNAQNVALYTPRPGVETGFLFSENGNGPHRGVRMCGVSAKGFNSAIRFETPDPAAIAAEGVVLEGCVFAYNGMALKAVSTITGLRVAGCQIEANGYGNPDSTIGGKINGPITIVDNNLEGQKNPLNFDDTTPTVIVENNYFENNPGDYLVRIKGTNANAHIAVRRNWQSTADTHGDTVLCQGVLTVNESELWHVSGFRRAIVTLLNTSVYYGSRFRGPIYVGTAPGNYAVGFADYRTLSRSTPDGYVYSKDVGADSVKTPFGETGTALKVSTYPTLGPSLNLAYSTGDVVMACALVHAKKAGRTPLLDVRNDAIESIGVQTPAAGFPCHLATEDEWYVAFACGVATAGGTKLNFRFGSDGVAANPGVDMHVAGIGAGVCKAADFQSLNGRVTRAFAKLFVPY